MRDSLGKTGTPALCEAACIPGRWCLSGSDRSSGTRREAAVVAHPTKIGGAGSFRHGCPASPSLCAAEAGRQPCLARPATRMCGGSHRPLGPARPRSACGAPSRALSGLTRAAFGCPPELMGPLSGLDVRSPAEPPRAEAALPSGLLPPAWQGGFLVCFWLRAAPWYTAEAGSRCCERRPRTGSPTRCWNFNKSATDSSSGLLLWLPVVRCWQSPWLRGGSCGWTSF